MLSFFQDYHVDDGNVGEINLTSVLDILSTLIIFVLLTAAWYKFSELNIIEPSGTEKVAFKEIGRLQVIFTENPEKFNILLEKGPLVRKWENVRLDQMKFLVQFVKNLGIDQALIMPKSQTPYQRVITIVDIVKLMEPQNIEIQKQGG